MTNERYDLEDRLIEFASLIVDISKIVEKSTATSHLTKQLIRSGTAPALLYGEAQSSESRADFVHKFKLILKELRESKINLKIIKKIVPNDHHLIDTGIVEANQLISIFVASLKTVNRNKRQ